MTEDLSKTDDYSLRSGGLALWLIALGALALRWVHLWLVSGTDLVGLPIIDAAFYHQWASAISQGELVGDRIFFMSPLYPYLTGLVYALVGALPWKMMALQGLLGVGTVLLLYRWGARLMGRTVGWVAAGLAALYAPFIFYEATLLTATIILFLSAVILNLTESVLAGARRRDLWLLGIVLGLSALARPLALMFLPLIYLLFFMNHRPTTVRHSAIVTVGVLIILLPVGIRNLVIGGDFTLTTSSAGMNFHVGNNPDATGLYWEAPFLSSVEPQYEDEDYRRVASEVVGRELTTREAGSYWFSRSLDWMINHPFGYITLLARKIFYFWNRAEFANNISIYLGRSLSPLLKFNPVGFWLIGPLGLAGLIRMWRRFGWKRARVAWLWLAAYFVGCVIFFVASEYRLPVVLPLMVGTGALIVEVVERFKARRFEPAMRLVALGLLFMPLTNWRTDFIIDGENPRMDWFNLGNTMMKQGRYIEAIDRFQEVLDIDPYFAEGLLRQAEGYYRAGMEDKAIEIGRWVGLEEPETILKLVRGEALREAYALLDEGRFGAAMREFSMAGWDSASAAAETTRVSLMIQAQGAYQAGSLEEALRLFKQINAAESPGDPLVLHNIAFIHWQLGGADSSEYYADTAMEIDSMNAPTAQLLARIYNASGRREEAEQLLRRVSPEPPVQGEVLDRVRVEMDSLTGRGEWEEALEAYGRYGRLRFETLPEDKLRLGHLQLEVGNLTTALRLLTEAEAAGIDEPDLYLHLGRTYVALASPEEALAALQKAIALNPDLITARIALARVYLSQGRIKQAWSELDAVSHLKILDHDLAKEYYDLVDSLRAL